RERGIEVQILCIRLLVVTRAAELRRRYRFRGTGNLAFRHVPAYYPRAVGPCVLEIQPADRCSPAQAGGERAVAERSVDRADHRADDRIASAEIPPYSSHQIVGTRLDRLRRSRT